MDRIVVADDQRLLGPFALGGLEYGQPGNAFEFLGPGRAAALVQ